MQLTDEGNFRGSRRSLFLPVRKFTNHSLADSYNGKRKRKIPPGRFDQIGKSLKTCTSRTRLIKGREDRKGRRGREEKAREIDLTGATG